MPAYGAGWGCKIVMPGVRLDSDRLNVPLLVVQSPGGESQEVRLPAERYREIIAATNFKQRVRKMLEYYHADRLHYAVIGTPNRLEYDQGFFVKGGDGLADLKPIAHLFKTQVYQIGAHLGVPAEVMARPADDRHVVAAAVAGGVLLRPADTRARSLPRCVRPRRVGRGGRQTDWAMHPEQVKRVYRDIRQKREATRYLHTGPQLVVPVALDGKPPVDDLTRCAASPGLPSPNRATSTDLQPAADGGSDPPPRPGRLRRLHRRQGEPRPHAARDHRPRRRRAAARQRGRPGAGRLQRRDLQLPRASRRSAAAGASLRDAQRHRSAGARLRGVGRAACCERLIGQFAFALYDRREGALLLARDRFGVRPLFYAHVPGGLVFGSEVKALFASGLVAAGTRRAGTRRGLHVLGRAAAAHAVPGRAGARARLLGDVPGGPVAHRPVLRDRLSPERDDRAAGRASSQLDELLRSAVQLRLRADVPVGGYLSGGLDSTITCALAARRFAAQAAHVLRDVRRSALRRERLPARGGAGGRQRARGRSRSARGRSPRRFPTSSGFTETPLVRTAPVPMYLLARLTRERGITVVLTGEGADEFFLGYDLFKEVKIRRFCQRQPASHGAPRLFQRLYPYLGGHAAGGRVLEPLLPRSRR